MGSDKSKRLKKEKLNEEKSEVGIYSRKAPGLSGEQFSKAFHCQQECLRIGAQRSTLQYLQRNISLIGI